MEINQEELRKQCKKFFWCETISDCQDLLEIYIECFFQVVQNHHNDEIKNHAEYDAKIVIQMMLTKALNLKSVLFGVNHISKNGKKLNSIIDPTIVASLIRNIYETTGMFNLIYRETKNDDEKKILYLLWVHAGLAYRQKFETTITKEENQIKSDNEKKQMANIQLEIENNPLFKKLDKKNQGKIRTKIKEKDYLMMFNNLEIEFLSWREIVNSMKIKNGKLDTTYTYFSLYSHPSNVSVFQFSNMFEKNNEAYPDLVIFNLQIAFYMFSVFIADYIHLFPKVIKTYEEMELAEQIVINFHNAGARGHEYDINETWKHLG